jgi:hypothetical protein
MDLETLVRRAAQRDVGAFVELTRRFQQFAFGSALAMVGDFHRAEDVVQEAFVAACRSSSGANLPVVSASQARIAPDCDICRPSTSSTGTSPMTLVEARHASSRIWPPAKSTPTGSQSRPAQFRYSATL